ncbi:electron transfer flavoprotein subunit beta/FixA family protein [Aliifodinibius sp. S!AR15-10]|uniref:electron transfer flavoprotein subunit beta/FixA family protein n=1 Tax=Aliifodinibius sp. S!AR15-10 TaxID=2950437 RepID=UPI00285D5E1F|nr:electron transfer flavoprotein subunit beta/FixA family protein [Aliifodinibius sp. S!AR15-10]MDR8393517.1 electron transfer flavoprotein subunit beta/FixA family protein [Aliifodinibius sp. S!AR15-10]
MKFYVCIKQVPDVNAPIQIKEGKLIQDTDRMILNAYDASAVEEALVLTEEHGGEVEVVSIGPDKTTEAIRKALAMGADKAVHIKTSGDQQFDSASYAEILAAYFKDKEYDVISCGKQSQDTDAGLTGSMLAEKLDLPYATNAVGLSIENEQLIVKRQGDSGQEMIALPPPCLVTCSNDMNEPRIPSLKGIMQSKKKPLETIELSDLDIDEKKLSPKTKVSGYREKPARKAGQKFEGEPDELARKVANLLDEEANVI